MEPMTVSQHTDPQEPIDQTAAAWVARLGGGRLSVAERRGLDAWLEADPRHRAAFKEAQEAWGLMGALAADRDLLAGDLASLTPPRTRRGGVLRRAAAVAACLLLLVVGGGVWVEAPLSRLAADHATAYGERQVVMLEDGSRVTLGPDTAIDIRFDGAARRVVLLSGVAIFDVTAQAEAGGRPFEVAAGAGTVRALGTEFMVEYHAEAIEVTVLEHAVAVTLADSAETQPVRVERGASVRYDTHHVEAPHSQDLARATAWQRDRLIFDRVPLSDVVATLNRYRPGRIVIANPDLAARTVSGVFNTDRPDRALATIIRELGAETASLPPLVTVLY